MNDLLSWLFAGHMVGDYIFQTRWMAEKKTELYTALFTHAAIYTCSIWVASLLCALASGFAPAEMVSRGLSLPCVLFVFVTHSIIDKRGITKWWCKNVTKSNRVWLIIMTDQALHIVVLGAACLLERCMTGGLF